MTDVMIENALLLCAQNYRPNVMLKLNGVAAQKRQWKK